MFLLLRLKYANDEFPFWFPYLSLSLICINIFIHFGKFYPLFPFPGSMSSIVFYLPLWSFQFPFHSSNDFIFLSYFFFFPLNQLTLHFLKHLHYPFLDLLHHCFVLSLVNTCIKGFKFMAKYFTMIFIFFAAIFFLVSILHLSFVFLFFSSFVIPEWW